MIHSLGKLKFQELSGLVRLDSENGAIILDDSIKDFNQLPIGNHRIRVLAKDSSYNKWSNSKG